MKMSVNASKRNAVSAILLTMAMTKMPSDSYDIFKAAYTFLSGQSIYFERADLINMMVGTYRLKSFLGYPMEDIEAAMTAIAEIVGLGDEFSSRIGELKYKNHIKSRGKNVHKEE